MLAEQGYLIPAVNIHTVDYVRCAVHLARSIRQWHPKANIALVTVGEHSDPVFDHVIALPHGDQGGYANDWQMFAASPYRQTIKLEADMIAASPIDHWWTLFEHRDVVISQGCRNFYNAPSTSRHYRKLFDNNNLPDVYNAVTYWRMSQTAREFFTWVKQLFQNWDTYRSLLKFADPEPTTDVVYAMVACIMGIDRVCLPESVGPSIVHMKKKIIGTKTDDWTKELVWEHTDPGLRIQTVAQWGLVHYNVKTWK